MSELCHISKVWWVQFMLGTGGKPLRILRYLGMIKSNYVRLNYLPDFDCSLKIWGYAYLQVHV